MNEWTTENDKYCPECGSLGAKKTGERMLNVRLEQYECEICEEKWYMVIKQ